MQAHGNVARFTGGIDPVTDLHAGKGHAQRLLGIVDRPTLVLQAAESADIVADLAEDDEAPIALRRALSGAAKLNSTRQNVLNRSIKPPTVIEDFTVREVRS